MPTATTRPNRTPVRCWIPLLALVSSAFVFVPPHVAWAGAWVTPPDVAYVKIGAAFGSSRDRFDFAGKRRRLENGLRFSETMGAGYVAVGLLPRVELNVATSVKSVRLDGTDRDDRTSGFSDINAGVKVGLIELPFIASVQLDVKVPTGYDNEVDPPLGDGQVDVGGRLLLGGSLHDIGVPGYVGIEGGYRHRAETPGDEWFVLGEAGASVTEDFGVRFKVDGSYAREIPVDDESATDLFASQKRVTRLDSTFWLAVAADTYVEVGYVDVLDARNLTGGSNWNVGLVRRFRIVPSGR